MSRPDIIAANRRLGSSRLKISDIVSCSAFVRSSGRRSITCAIVVRSTRAATGWRSAWYVSRRLSCDIPLTTWDHVDCWINRLEVVELVLAVPAIGQPLCGRVGLVEHTERALANVGVVRMATEPGAGEPAVPGPVVLGVRRGMNSHVSATSLDVALEIVLLCGVQYVAGCVQPDDCAVPREVLRGEGAGIFGRVDGEPILLSELPDSGESHSDGAVAVSGRLGEDEYARLLAACGDRNADRSEQKRERGESLHGMNSNCSAL